VVEVVDLTGEEMEMIDIESWVLELVTVKVVKMEGPQHIVTVKQEAPKSVPVPDDVRGDGVEEEGLAEEEEEVDLTQYELEREAIIARNKTRMTDLGVVGLAEEAGLPPPEQPPPPLLPPLSPSRPHASASRRHNDSFMNLNNARRCTLRARGGGTKCSYAEVDSEGDDDEDYEDEGDDEEEEEGEEEEEVAEEDEDERATARANATGRRGAKSHGSRPNKRTRTIPHGLDLEVFCKDYSDGRLAHLPKEWAHPTAVMASFPHASNKKVPWKCGECENEWEAAIHDRTRSDRPSGCPECYDNRRCASDTNNLEVFCENSDGRYAHLRAEWAHPTAAMASFTRGSDKKVPWKCGECGNEWDATIESRTRSGRPSGCPHCSNQRRRVKK
jgi:DNA-directed RNA polymerase subunit RPC12/RpoP